MSLPDKIQVIFLFIMSSAGISLVTGGCGFIGRHLVEALINRGRQVRVLDLQGDPSIFHHSVELQIGSILNKQALTTAMQGVSVVYHLAALPHLWSLDPNDFYRVNVEGTKTLLEVAREADLDRFVYTSSETVLRSWKNQSTELINEMTPLPKLDELPGPYSKSKFIAELSVKEAIDEGLPGLIVYPTIPIGPGDVNLTPPTRMIRDFLTGKNLAFMECNLNLIPVHSVASGHLAAAERGLVGERYILGQENLRMSAFLSMIESQIGKKMPKTKVPYLAALASAKVMEWKAKFTKEMPQASIEGVRLAAANMHFDSAKSSKELKLPQSSIQDALKETARWLEDQQLLI